MINFLKFSSLLTVSTLIISQHAFATEPDDLQSGHNTGHKASNVQANTNSLDLELYMNKRNDLTIAKTKLEDYLLHKENTVNQTNAPSKLKKSALPGIYNNIYGWSTATRISGFFQSNIQMPSISEELAQQMYSEATHLLTEMDTAQSLSKSDSLIFMKNFADFFKKALDTEAAQNASTSLKANIENFPPLDDKKLDDKQRDRKKRVHFKET
ncbi:MAG: hypothetical protein JSR85_00725 [Proteobacteria bacterium]|nr:hypothetical protein [Pseudomonadota bacterium]